MSRFNEKTSFGQSMDERVCVKMSMDKKGYVASSFCHFFRHLEAFIGMYQIFISVNDSDTPLSQSAGTEYRSDTANTEYRLDTFPSIY